MLQPGDDRAARRVSRSRLRASHGDREQGAGLERVADELDAQQANPFPLRLDLRFRVLVRLKQGIDQAVANAA